MTIHEFYEKFIEGYLFSDLENMSRLKPINNSYGAAGYPMLITTLSGMELLGALVQERGEQFSPSSNAGRVYFLDFWEQYLSQSYSEYSGLGNIFRALIRNGISHTFLAKKGVAVTKGTNLRPIIDKENETLVVDAVTLYEDFREVVKNRVKPILKRATGNPSASTMQVMLNGIEQSYNSEKLAAHYRTSSAVSQKISQALLSGTSLSNLAVTGTFSTTTNPILQKISDGEDV